LKKISGGKRADYLIEHIHVSLDKNGKGGDDYRRRRGAQGGFTYIGGRGGEMLKSSVRYVEARDFGIGLR